MSFLIPRDKSVINVNPNRHNQEGPVQPGGSEYTIQSGFSARNPGAGPNGRHLSLKELEEQDSSVINFYPAWCRCFSCLIAKKYRRSDNVPKWTRLKNAFLCPPSGVLSRFLYFILFNGLLWIFAWGLDGNVAKQNISALIVLEILGLTFGIFMKLVSLPSLLAPLILGIVLNNMRFEISHLKFNFFWGLHHRKWIEPIRHIALTIILTRAGTELSPKQMRKMKGLVPLAAFGPCLVEAFTCAGVMYWLFRNDGISIAMCFVAGFALAAVSPAVVVPGLLSLQKKNYGVKEGIPTLLIAASSIDDVLAISAYSIALSFTKQMSADEWKSYAGPVGIVVGLAHGIIVGIFLHFIPSKDMGRQVPLLRLIILMLFNLSCMFVYQYEAFSWLSGAGSLGVLTTSFIASFGWRSVPFWKPGMRRIETALAHTWTLFVPLLFGTIGNEIHFGKDFDWDSVAKLVGVIAISLTTRMLAMFLISGCAKINKKEQLFCALSWIPKATVQATLAPLVASEFEDEPDDSVQKKLSRNVVLLAVLGILITAPLGAVLISLTGKRLLRQSKNEPDEFPNGGDENEVKELVAHDGDPLKSSSEMNGSKTSEIVFADIPMEGALGLSGKLSGPSKTTVDTNNSGSGPGPENTK